MEPTIHGMPLELGMHIDDAAPDCCHGPMDSKAAANDAHREYACRDCGVVVEVDALGLVFDIRE